jgi:hypothetical protein
MDTMEEYARHGWECATHCKPLSVCGCVEMDICPVCGVPSHLWTDRGCVCTYCEKCGVTNPPTVEKCHCLSV